MDKGNADREFTLADPGGPCFPHAPDYKHSFVKKTPVASPNYNLTTDLGPDDAKMENIFHTLATTCVLSRQAYVFHMDNIWRDEQLFRVNWDGLFTNHMYPDAPRGLLDASDVMKTQFDSK